MCGDHILGRREGNIQADWVLSRERRRRSGKEEEEEGNRGFIVKGRECVEEEAALSQEGK